MYLYWGITWSCSDGYQHRAAVDHPCCQLKYPNIVYKGTCRGASPRVLIGSELSLSGSISCDLETLLCECSGPIGRDGN